MIRNIRSKIYICTMMALPLLGCGGSESTTMAEMIKLSGPLSLAAAADAPVTAGSINVVDTMSAFPSGILDDFASRFPAVSAEEQYRRITYDQSVVVSEMFVVSGESADVEGVEISAEYTVSGNYSSSVSTEEGVLVPAAVTDVMAVLYPGVSLDEVEEQTDNDGNVTYEGEFEISGSEFEVIFDVTGNLLKMEEELAVDQIPSNVSLCFQQELTGNSEVEYESFTDNMAGVLSYEAEIEGAGEGVSIHCSGNGDVISIEYAIDL